MSWAKLDDNFDENPKQLQMGDAAFRVWVCSFTYCARQRPITGFLTEAQAQGLVRKLGKSRKVVDELVRLRGWERVSGGYAIHDYAEYVERGSSDRVGKWRESKKMAGITESQLTALRETVFARDHYTCRYCGNRPDRRQLVADHIIPTPHGPSTPGNLVTACRSCNRRKGSRTPDEAGMPLLPVTSADVDEEVTVTSEVTDSESNGNPSRGYPVPEPVTVQSPPTSDSDPPTPLERLDGHFAEGYEAFLAALRLSTRRSFRGDAISRGLYAGRRHEGYSADDLEAAARGAPLSAHHAGLNKLQVPLTDPTHVLKSSMLDALIGLGRGEIGVTRAETVEERRTREWDEMLQRHGEAPGGPKELHA